MTITKPTVGSPGWNDAVDDLIDEHNERGSAVRLHALGSTQTIIDQGFPTIDLTTQEFNTNTDVFTVSLAANTITVNRSGTFLVPFEVTFNGGSVGNRYGIVRVDGVDLRVIGTGEAITHTASGSPALRLTAGQVVTLGAYVDGGSTVNVQAGAIYDTGISVVYLGA